MTLLINKSDFIVTVQKQGDRIAPSKPITVRNQIQEIKTIDDLPGINTSALVDKALLIYNANTQEYHARLPVDGEFVNSSYIATLTANNTLYAYGKQESDLSVNFASLAGDANFAFLSNNSLNLNGLPGSYYSNASNLTGTLNSNNLPFTGVIPGQYGNNTNVPVITVDETGRITTISTAISAGGGSGVVSFNYVAGNNSIVLETTTDIFVTPINTVNNFTVTGNLSITGSINIDEGLF